MFLLSSEIKMKMFHKFCVIMLVGAFLFSPQAKFVAERWATVFSGEDYNLSEAEDHGGGRLAIWSSGMVLFSENLITGVGVGNSSTSMGERYGHTAWKTMHNAYIQITLELGIFGLLVFILMMRMIWKNCTLVITKARNVVDERQMLVFATSLRISLLVYMIGAFFLSQAYSILIPLLLVVSDRIRFFTFRNNSEEL